MMDSSRYWTRVGGLAGIVFFIAVVLLIVFRKIDREVAPNLVRLGTVIFALMWLALMALRFADKFRHGDLDATAASVLSGLGSGFFVVSWAAIGGFLISIGRGVNVESSFSVVAWVVGSRDSPRDAPVQRVPAPRSGFFPTFSFSAFW